MKHLSTTAIAIAAVACAQSSFAQPERPSFEALDIDDSGTLSKEELQESMSRMAGWRAANREREDETRVPDPERAAAMLDRFFATLDSDGDGSVSREEFELRPSRPDRRRRDAEPDAV